MKYVLEQLSNEFSSAVRFHSGGTIKTMRGCLLQTTHYVPYIMSCFRARTCARLFTYLLICSFLLIPTVNAFSDTTEQSLEILKRIKAAENEVSFVGTRLSILHMPHGITLREEFVIHHPPRVHAVKALSVAGSDHSLGFDDTERLKGRNGRRRRPGPGDRHPGRWQPLPPRKRISTLSQEEMELLAQNYRFDSSPGNAIMDQETDVIKISPQYEGRPTKRLHISRENGIILRTEDIDSTGNLRFMSVYTQIDFGREKVRRTLAELKNNEKGSFEDQSRRSRPIGGAEAEKALGDRLVKPTYLPLGFQLLDIRYIKHRSVAVFLRYTDGLVTFSLFERKGRRFFHIPGRRHRDKHRGRGGKIVPRHDVPIHIMKQHQAHILEWSNSGVDFTLIGELDPSELIKVAESVILATKK